MALMVFCFPNGNYSVTDESGEQVLDAQGSWILAIADRIAKAGYDPTGASVLMPYGRRAHFFVTSSGLNWRITEDESMPQ